MISTDLCVIGSGAVALFAVFEAGQFNMRCHVIDSGPNVDKTSANRNSDPLYHVLAGKIAVFNPSFSVGARVEHVVKDDLGRYIVTTNREETIICKSLLFATEAYATL